MACQLNSLQGYAMENWWGNKQLKIHDQVEHSIGPLWLSLQRQRHEIILSYYRDPDWDESYLEQKLPIRSLPELTTTERYVLHKDDQEITLLPSLADRPVVARPATPFIVPANEYGVIFVSTPIWVTLYTTRENICLAEIPVIRLSDTWFGENTREGQICYDSRTSARMDTEDLPLYSHRAVTPVKIVNDSETHLLLERINLPIPYLHLYHTSDGFFCTQQIVMTREADEVTVTLEILTSPHPQFQQADLLTQAREAARERTIISKFSSLFA